MVLICNVVEGIKAFIGGIDITDGRFDNSNKSLFSSLQQPIHKDDFYQNCIPPDCVNKEKGPREPWQDIHACVTGDAAVDILQNFIERWHRQAGRWLSSSVNINMSKSLVYYIILSVSIYVLHRLAEEFRIFCCVYIPLH